MPLALTWGGGTEKKMLAIATVQKHRWQQQQLEVTTTFVYGSCLGHPASYDITSLCSRTELYFIPISPSSAKLLSRHLTLNMCLSLFLFSCMSLSMCLAVLLKQSPTELAELRKRCQHRSAQQVLPHGELSGEHSSGDLHDLPLKRRQSRFTLCCFKSSYNPLKHILLSPIKGQLSKI